MRITYLQWYIKLGVKTSDTLLLLSVMQNMLPDYSIVNRYNVKEYIIVQWTLDFSPPFSFFFPLLWMSVWLSRIVILTSLMFFECGTSGSLRFALEGTEVASYRTGTCEKSVINQILQMPQILNVEYRNFSDTFVFRMA